MSPDGTRIVSGSDDYTLRIWDASSGDTIAVLQGHSSGVWSVAYTSDGSQIASGSGDHTIRLWDATTGHELLRLEGHTAEVNSVSFSPEDDRIASGSDDKSIRVWDAANGICLATLEGCSDGVRSVTFFSGSDRLVSGGNDGTVCIWDLSTANCATILKGHSWTDYSLSLSPDGSQIASASDDQTIRIQNVNVSDETSPAGLALEGHTGGVTSAVFSTSGDRIVSGSLDSTVRLWNATTGESIAVFAGHTDCVRSAVLSSNDRYIVSGSDDGTIKTWDASAVPEDATETEPLPSAEVVSLAFSSDGERLVSMDYSDLVQIRDTDNGHVVVWFKAEAPFILRRGWRAGFSPDNSQIILHHDDPTDPDWCEPISFDASNGDPTTGVEVPAFDIYRPQTSLKLAIEGGKLLRHDVSPPATVCILPHFLPAIALSAISEPVDGMIRVAIACIDDRIIILHVRL